MIGVFLLWQFGPFLRMVEMDVLCAYGNHNVVGAVFSSQRIKAGNHIIFRHSEQIIKRCVIPKLLYGGNHAADTTISLSNRQRFLICYVVREAIADRKSVV